MSQQQSFPANLHLSLEPAPAPGEVEFVWEQLAAYNRLYAGQDNHQPLTIFWRESKQAIVGGLLGGTYWDWLHIDILWIHTDLRGQGYGRALLEAAEQEAVKRGCRYAHLETHTFQAVEFYQKQNYTIFGELPDLPRGYTKYFLKKTLKNP
jgi:ribosomal protein S18 acetylase RimI-like enzyme